MENRPAGGFSIPGPARPRNEDALFCSDNGRVLALADGVGSLYHSGTASLEACERVRDASNSLMVQGMYGIRNFFREAESDFRIRYAKNGSPNGGTTLTLVVIWPGKLFIGAIGDSPAILVSSDQVLQLYPEFHDRALSDNRSQPGFLGSGIPSQWDVRSFDLAPGSCLLLLSDGVSGVLPIDQIGTIARKHEHPELIATEMLQTAVRRGAEDNCSCLVSLPEGLRERA